MNISVYSLTAVAKRALPLPVMHVAEELATACRQLRLTVPVRWAQKEGRPIALVDKQAHRAEIAAFAQQVAGAEVGFAAASYREWLSGNMEKATSDHARRLFERFAP